MSHNNENDKQDSTHTHNNQTANNHIEADQEFFFLTAWFGARITNNSKPIEKSDTDVHQLDDKEAYRDIQ